MLELSSEEVNSEHREFQGEVIAIDISPGYAGLTGLGQRESSRVIFVYRMLKTCIQTRPCSPLEEPHLSPERTIKQCRL